MKNDLLRYRAKIDADDEGGNVDEFGIRQIGIVVKPASKIKGLAFACEEKFLSFSDEPKMRLAAPVMVPSITYRKAKDGEPDYEVELTREDVEKAFLKLMANPEKLRNVFNTEHNAEQTAPAYILEIWLIGDNPKGDRSFTEFGIECPVGTIFAVAQFTDKEYYDTIVREDRLGFSFEGQFGLELQMSEENSDLEMSENSNNIQLEEKAEEILLTNTNKKMKEGEKFQIGENWFIVKDGMPTACNEAGEVQMAEEVVEKKTEDAEEMKTEEVEMAEENPAPQTGGMTEEEISKIVATQIETVVKPMIDEAMKAVIETIGGKAEENVSEEDKKKAELQYAEEKEEGEKVGFMDFVKMSAKKK